MSTENNGLKHNLPFSEGGKEEMFASAAADKTCGRQSFSFYPNLAWSILDLLSVLCIRDSFAADKRNTTYDDMFLSSRKSLFDLCYSEMACEAPYGPIY